MLIARIKPQHQAVVTVAVKHYDTGPGRANIGTAGISAGSSVEEDHDSIM